MEPIKITIEVNLSKSTEEFLSSLFDKVMNNGAATTLEPVTMPNAASTVGKSKGRPGRPPKIAIAPKPEPMSDYASVSGPKVIEPDLSFEPNPNLPEDFQAEEPAEVAQAEPVAKPALGAVAAPAVSSATIEDVRGILATKVLDYREEIKAKLAELGAPSVTRLDPSHYQEMYDFLKAL